MKYGYVFYELNAEGEDNQQQEAEQPAQAPVDGQ